MYRNGSSSHEGKRGALDVQRERAQLRGERTRRVTKISRTVIVGLSHTRILWALILLLGAVQPAVQTSSVQAAMTGRAVSAASLSRMASANRLLSALPLGFEADHGRAQFVAQGPGYSLSLTPTAMLMSLSEQHGTAETRLQFVHANARAQAIALQRLPGKVNYFLGNDSRRWRTDVPTYGRIEYRNVYPGIDLVYHGLGGHLEYDWVVAPGAHADLIRLQVQGPSAVRLDHRSGNLVIGAGRAQVVHHKPVLYQWIAGARHPVVGQYVQIGKDEIGFRLGRHDPNRPVVIDPTIQWSTYISGHGHDKGNGIAVQGNTIFVAGETQSTDLPKAIDGCSNGNTTVVCADAFVTAIDASTGAIRYTTYVGGTTDDWANGIAADSSGSIYIVGESHSTDLPKAVGPCYAAYGYCDDAFMAKLDGATGSLAYTTNMGGTSRDYAEAIALDGSGNAYVAGFTASSDFQHATNPCPSLCQDAFVAQVNAATGAVASAMFVGGSAEDYGEAITLDAGGSVYLAGTTQSPDLPKRTNTCANNCTYSDGFVAKVQPATGSVTYSTYIGGSQVDNATAVALSGGTLFVAGGTSSADLGGAVNACALTPTYGTCSDAYLARVDPTNGSIQSTEYFGGHKMDYATGLAVGPSGDIYLEGHTESVDLPAAVNSCNVSKLYNVCEYPDAFVAQFTPTGTLLSSMYLGGTDKDEGTAIALDSSGNGYITGMTGSIDLPNAVNNCISFGVACADDAFVMAVSGLDGAAPAQPAITVAPAQGFNGDTVVVNGTNFGPNEQIDFFWDDLNDPLLAAPAAAPPASGSISPDATRPGVAFRPAGQPGTTSRPATVAGASAATDARGSFSATLTVPAATGGRHHIIAVGHTSGKQASIPFTVLPHVSLSPTAATAGSTVTLTGSGFGATETVSARWNSTSGPSLGTGTTSSTGAVSFSFTVPSSAGAGLATVYVTGASSNLSTSASFTVSSQTQSSLSLDYGAAYDFSMLHATGASFVAGESVKLYWDTTSGTPLATATASSTGSFTQAFFVPQTPGGAHTVIAVGQTSGQRAQAPVTIRASSFLSIGYGNPGDSVTLTGYGFTAGETVQVRWGSTSGAVVASGSAGATGSTTIPFTVPNVAAGNVAVYGVGASSGGNYKTVFTVTSGAQLISNGGFENGATGWQQSSAQGRALIDGVYPRTGSRNADLCASNACTDTLSQTVTLPSSFSSITLSYWYYIITDETGTACNDHFTVTVQTPGGATITTPQSVCNTNATSGWTQYTATLTSGLSAYRGQQVVLRFQGTTDSSNPSRYLVDDVSLSATSGPPATLTVDQLIVSSGATVQLSGTGFERNEQVVLLWNCASSSCAGVPLKTVLADGTGAFTGQVVTIPAAPAGTYSLGARGISSHAFATATITVVPNVRGSRRILSLPAKQAPPGLDSQISVAAGMQISVAATGRATYGSEGAGLCGSLPYTDPSGQRYKTATTTTPCGPKLDHWTSLPSSPIGTLLGHILGTTGSATTTPSAPLFALGGSQILASPQTGRLYLLYNDEPWGYGNNGGSYSVTVTTCNPDTYTDVPAADPNHGAIATVARKGILLGYANCSFKPLGNITQAQLAAVLALATAEPPAPTASPALAATRGQLAQMAVTAAHLPLLRPATPTFHDVPVTSPLYPYVETAAHAGLMVGFPCSGTLRPCDSQHRPYFLPGNLTTRGETARAASGLVSQPAPVVPIVPVVYEAESPINTLAGGAVVNPCGFCSGGQYVRMIGYSGTLTFNGIKVSTSGTYKLTLTYVNGDPTRPGCIAVNPATPPSTAATGCGAGIAITFLGTGWDHVETYSLSVQLHAGTNSIVYYSPTGWAPDMDKIEVAAP